MEKIQVDYTVTVSDFRKASYYGLFLRHRRPLQIMFAVLIGAVLYGAGSYLGLGTANPLVFFLAAAYLCWGLLLFAGTERSIRQDMRTPGHFLPDADKGTAGRTAADLPPEAGEPVRHPVPLSGARGRRTALGGPEAA